MKIEVTEPDLTISGVGSTVCLLRPRTRLASHWVEQNLDYESWQVTNGSIAVDHRFVQDIAYLSESQGLLVELT